MVNKGDRVRVVKGKSRGAEGEVFWIGETKYGARIGIDIGGGEKVWTNPATVVATSTDVRPAPAMPTDVAPAPAAPAPMGLRAMAAALEAPVVSVDALVARIAALEARVAALEGAAPVIVTPLTPFPDVPVGSGVEELRRAVAEDDRLDGDEPRDWAEYGVDF